MGKRDARYEFIRVIAMMLVICVHAFAGVSPAYAEESLAGMALSTLFFVGNGLFFMISGRFALRVCCRTGKDYRIYYLKRFGSLGIPILVGMLLRTGFNVGGWWPEYYFSVDFLKEYIQNVLYNFASCEYWFLYRLVGFLVAAPFLGKMVQQATRTELLWLAGVGMLWNGLSLYLPAVGFPFAWDFPLGGCLVLFILGYAVEHIVQTEREENLLIFLGGIGFVLTVLLKYVGLAAGADDLAPTYTVMVCGAFVWLKRLYRPGKVLDAFVLQVGSLSMSVYLVHMIVMHSIISYIPQWSFYPRAVTLQLATAGISLAAAFVLEKTILAGLKWGYRKLTGL